MLYAFFLLCCTAIIAPFFLNCLSVRHTVMYTPLSFDASALDFQSSSKAVKVPRFASKSEIKPQSTTTLVSKITEQKSYKDIKNWKKLLYLPVEVLVTFIQFLLNFCLKSSELQGENILLQENGNKNVFF